LGGDPATLLTLLQGKKMNSISVATVIFAASFGGVLFGMYLQRILPKYYLEPETKEIVRLATGLIATMTALVLGLLVSSAKSSFDQESDNFRQLALNVVLLDRTLDHYGAEARPVRDRLKSTVAQTINVLWPTESMSSGKLNDASITVEGAALYDSLRKLSPGDESQRSMKEQALQLSTELMRDRWRANQSTEGSLPTIFLVVVAFWLAVLFTSFALFSPRNKLTVAALLICAASVAGAVLLIVDLDQPFDGLVTVPSAPFREALSQLRQ
jgi:hypothetical protein